MNELNFILCSSRSENCWMQFTRHMRNSSHEKVFLVDGALTFVQLDDEKEFFLLLLYYSDHQIIMMSVLSTNDDAKKTFQLLLDDENSTEKEGTMMNFILYFQLELT
jgi:hypothetical protein